MGAEELRSQAARPLYSCNKDKPRHTVEPKGRAVMGEGTEREGPMTFMVLSRPSPTTPQTFAQP
jgi:hypothetical protein